MKNKGFTLIELLVTVSILILLTAIASVSYRTVSRRARDGKRQSDLESVRTALEIYRADNDVYPTSASFSLLLGDLTGYLNTAPADPRPTVYRYYYDSDGISYDLCAYLEGGGSDSCGDYVLTMSGPSCNYEVNNP